MRGPRLLPGLLIVVALALAACDTSDSDVGRGDGGGASGGGSIDPTPENKYGVPSQQFEPEDIERAEAASEAVKDYCAGAVSEAQRIGCESHVDESDIP